MRLPRLVVPVVLAGLSLVLSFPKSAPASAETMPFPGAPRFSPGIAFDARADVAYVFGGVIKNEAGTRATVNELWKCDLATGVWQLLSSGADGPSAREGAGLCLLPTGLLMIAGGCPSFPNLTCVGDAWLFDPLSGQWRQLPSGSTSYDNAYRSDIPLLADSRSGQAHFLFGSCARQGAWDDVLSFDPVTSKWAHNQSPVGTGIMARTWHVAAEASPGEFLTWGGFEIGSIIAPGQDSLWRSVWQFTPGAPKEWTQLSSGTLGPRVVTHACGTFDSISRLFLISGGLDLDTGAQSDSLWGYSPERNAWYLFSSGTGEFARSFGASAYSRRHGAIFLFGGTSGRTLFPAPELSNGDLVQIEPRGQFEWARSSATNGPRMARVTGVFTLPRGNSTGSQALTASTWELQAAGRDSVIAVATKVRPLGRDRIMLTFELPSTQPSPDEGYLVVSRTPSEPLAIVASASPLERRVPPGRNAITEDLQLAPVVRHVGSVWEVTGSTPLSAGPAPGFGLIEDVRGRVVARTSLSTSRNESAGAWNYTLEWNGRSSSGVPCPPGIYFCQIRGQGGGVAGSAKILLLE